MNTFQRFAWTGLLWAMSSCTTWAAEPIRIGIVTESTGANAELGMHSLRGAQFAVDEINKAGGVLGRPLELEIEDNQSTNPGSVRAFSKIIEKGLSVAVVGPIRSTQVLAIAPAVLKAGIPVMVGGTDYVLTHAGNPWIFRARPHDGYSAKVIADFGVNALKRSRWAIVHSTETFGISGKNRLVEALQAYGIVPVTVQSMNTGNSQDLSQLIQAINASNADIVASYIVGPTDVAAFATQLRQSGSSATLIGSPSLATDAALKLGGAALYDSYSIADFVTDANPEAKTFALKYKERFGLEADLFPSWAYDAVNLLAEAIKSANSTQPQAIRKSMLAIQGYKGAEGTYHYDQNGDGLHGYNVVRNDRGKVVFIKHVSFN